MRADLTKGERRYLRRFTCGWCDQSLDRDNCAAIYEACSSEARATRRAACLAGYKPRCKDAANLDAMGAQP